MARNTTGRATEASVASAGAGDKGVDGQVGATRLPWDGLGDCFSLISRKMERDLQVLSPLPSLFALN